MNQTKKFVQVYLAWALDVLVIMLSYYIATQIRFGVSRDYGNYTIHYMVMLVIILAATFYHLLFGGNKDFLKRGYFRELMEVLKMDCFIVAAAVIIVFMARWGFYISRLVFGWFLLINFVLMFLVRILSKSILRSVLKGESFQTKLLVVAEEAEMEKTIHQLLKQKNMGLVIVGAAYADKVIPEEDAGTIEIEGVPIVAGKKRLTEKTIQIPFDEVFINTPNIPVRQMTDIINRFEDMGVTVHYSLELSDVGKATSSIGSVGDYPVVSYSLHINSYKLLAVKRLVDIIGGFVGLVVVGILTLILAPLIKLDSPGPVFFSQTRIGKNGRRFKIYKYRSMYIDAEERLKDLQGGNQMNGLMFKMENDPRITKMGKFIRRTSLDEFPQLINVFKGDMSLVGTRPPTEKEFELYNEHYRRRLSMTPGITGLWQVSGRSEITDFDDVVKLDLTYIDNWSLALDLKILLQTVVVVFTGKGAE